MTLTRDERPVGTWFFRSYLGRNSTEMHDLMQQTESGPHYVCTIADKVSADFICEKLNDKPAHAQQANQFVQVHIKRLKDLIETASSRNPWEAEAAAEMKVSLSLLESHSQEENGK